RDVPVLHIHLFIYFSSSVYAHRRHLHSLPTRRSSDLFYHRKTSDSMVKKFIYLARRPGVHRRNFAQFFLTGIPHILQTLEMTHQDRKSTRLNSSHVSISYAVFCLKKKRQKYVTQV